LWSIAESQPIQPAGFMKKQILAALLAVCAGLGLLPRSVAGEDPYKGAGSIIVPLEKMSFQPQAPGLPQKVSTLWGNRDRDGGFGQLIELPPGFRSPLHTHSGDYHGVLIKGTWQHEDAAGKKTSVQPGSYVRQAGGEMHIDACVSKEPCLLFLFQYSRADLILAK
jgi:quercetin dioxygenase-like cupin family protein